MVKNAWQSSTMFKEMIQSDLAEREMLLLHSEVRASPALLQLFVERSCTAAEQRNTSPSSGSRG